MHDAATIVASARVGRQSPVLCADSVRAKMLVPNHADGTLPVIDTATLLVTATVPVGVGRAAKTGIIEGLQARSSAG